MWPLKTPPGGWGDPNSKPDDQTSTILGVAQHPEGTFPEGTCPSALHTQGTQTLHTPVSLSPFPRLGLLLGKTCSLTPKPTCWLFSDPPPCTDLQARSRPPPPLRVLLSWTGKCRWAWVRTGRLTLQDTMNMVKIKMRLALDTGSQRVCWRVKRIAPYRLALVGLQGTAMVTGRHGTAQAFGPLSQTPFSACPQPAPAPLV